MNILSPPIFLPILGFVLLLMLPMKQLLERVRPTFIFFFFFETFHFIPCYFTSLTNSKKVPTQLSSTIPLQHLKSSQTNYFLLMQGDNIEAMSQISPEHTPPEGYIRPNKRNFMRCSLH